jgi:protein involved in polysaccharide export with SLBB domain
MRSFSRLLEGRFLLLGIVLLIAGCVNPDPTDGSYLDEGPPVAPDVLRVGDVIAIIFSNVSPPPPPHEERIKEDGTINLPNVGVWKAAGKTAGELQRELQAEYVPRIYRNATVTVRPPDRYFYVYGDVRQPSRYVWTPGMTVVKAIATAGGFTDFSDQKRVELTRSTGEKLVINCKSARGDARGDRSVYPNDTVFVPKRLY